MKIINTLGDYYTNLEKRGEILNKAAEEIKQETEEVRNKIFAVKLILRALEKAYTFDSLTPSKERTHVPYQEAFDVSLGWGYEGEIYSDLERNLAKTRKQITVTRAVCSVLGIEFESTEIKYSGEDNTEGPQDIGSRFAMKFNIPVKMLEDSEQISIGLIEEAFSKVHASVV